MNANTTWSLTVFTQRNFVADFLQAKSNVNGKRLFGGLVPINGVHLRVIGKRVVDFLLVLIELFP